MFHLPLPTVVTLSVVLALSGAAAAWHAPLRLVPTDLMSHVQASTDGGEAGRRHRMGAIRNWGYWLSSADLDSVADAPHDLLVMDNGVSAGGRFQRERKSEEIARMKKRADGSARILLSYLSIGEAERYRPYWKAEWYEPGKKPEWLGAENPDWAGNYAVQYWHPEWQRLIFGSPTSYLDRIIDQGFDGIYLDRADAFLSRENVRPTARDDMKAFLTRMAEHARRRNPQFLVVMQNAEELVEDDEVLGVIDAIAKEDLFYGADQPGERNKTADVRWSLKLLRAAQRAERRVLVIEYLREPAKMATAYRRIVEEGFVPYFGPRMLSCLNPPAALTEARRLPEHPCR